MREITFENLLNEKISLDNESINVNETLLYNVKEIEFYRANPHSTHLLIKNEHDVIVSRVFVGSTQRVLVNGHWKYIKVV